MRKKYQITSAALKKYGYKHDKTDQAYDGLEEAFLHFKWAKSLSSITKAWPENWREIEYFQKLFGRVKNKKKYKGEYPKIIKERMRRNGPN